MCDIHIHKIVDSCSLRSERIGQIAENFQQICNLADFDRIGFKITFDALIVSILTDFDWSGPHKNCPYFDWLQTKSRQIL